MSLAMWERARSCPLFFSKFCLPSKVASQAEPAWLSWAELGLKLRFSGLSQLKLNVHIRKSGFLSFIEGRSLTSTQKKPLFRTPTPSCPLLLFCGKGVYVPLKVGGSSSWQTLTVFYLRGAKLLRLTPVHWLKWTQWEIWGNGNWERVI